jgi:hypothetical protein
MLIYRPSENHSRLAFSAWDEIVLDGIAFRVVDETDKGFVFVRVDGTGIAEFFEHATLSRRANAGLLTHNRNKFRPQNVVQSAHSNTDLLATLSDEEQAEVHYRLSMVDAANELHAEGILKRTEISIKANMGLIRERATQMLELNIATVGERRARREVTAARVGASTLRKWLKKTTTVAFTRWLISGTNGAIENGAYRPMNSSFYRGKFGSLSALRNLPKRIFFKTWRKRSALKTNGGLSRTCRSCKHPPEKLFGRR